MVSLLDGNVIIFYVFVPLDLAILDCGIMGSVGPEQPLVKRTVVTDQVKDA